MNSKEMNTTQCLELLADIALTELLQKYQVKHKNEHKQKLHKNTK